MAAFVTYFKQERETIALFVIIFAYLLLLNIFLPPQSDDYDAALKAHAGFQSAISSYFTWNGRIGEMLFVGFVAALPQYIFNPLNAAMGCAFIYALFVMIFARIPRKNDIPMICLICFCILFFTPFGSDFLWGAGSLNYMWGLLLIMLCFLPHRIFWQRIYEVRLEKSQDSHSQDSADSTQNPAHNPPNLDSTSACTQCNPLPLVNLAFFVPFAIFSFFAGMASEHVGVVCVIVHVILIVFALAKKIRLPLFYILSAVCFVAGYITLYCSPGGEIRTHIGIYNTTYMSLMDLLSLSITGKIRRIANTLYSTKTHIVFILPCVLSAFLYLKTYNRKTALKNIAMIVFCVILCLNKNIFLAHVINIMLCGAFIVRYNNAQSKVIALLYMAYILSNLACIQVIILPPRARLGEILIVVAIFCILFDMCENYTKLKTAIMAILVAYGAFVGIEYGAFRYRWNNMVAFVEEQKQAGNLNVVVPNIFYSHYGNFSDFPLPTDIITESPSTIYAREFGLKSFRVDEYHLDKILTF